MRAAPFCRYHQTLWSKTLPGGAHFDLDDTRRDQAYLYHGSTQGSHFFLASDSVIPTFTRWGFAAAHPGALHRGTKRGVHGHRLHDRRDERFSRATRSIASGPSTRPADATGGSRTGSISRSNASAGTTRACPALLVRRWQGPVTFSHCSRASTGTWISSCCRTSSSTTAPPSCFPCRSMTSRHAQYQGTATRTPNTDVAVSSSSRPETVGFER